jgi:hypothetical protein
MRLKKLSPLLLLSLLLTTCDSLPFALTNAFNSISTSLNSLSETPFFNSFSSDGGLVFIGAAGRRTNADETLLLALENAAERVAIFSRVAGEYAVVNERGSGAFDYSYHTKTTLSYNKEGSRQYVSSLQFDPDTDTFFYENTLFVRVVYPSALPYPVNYQPSYRGQNKKPTWIDNPPLEIDGFDGYEVVVGFSNRRSALADAFNNSRNNAIFAVIRNKNTISHSTSTLYQNTGSIFGYRTTHDNVIYAYGTLAGFYVLDAWIDPASKTVWTLAIAAK